MENPQIDGICLIDGRFTASNFGLLFSSINTGNTYIFNHIIIIQLHILWTGRRNYIQSNFLLIASISFTRNEQLFCTWGQKSFKGKRIKTSYQFVLQKYAQEAYPLCLIVSICLHWDTITSITQNLKSWFNSQITWCVLRVVAESVV